MLATTNCTLGKKTRTKVLVNQIKSLNNRLLEIEKKYKLVLDNAREIVFQTNTEGLWVFLSPVWKELTGFSVSESLGTPFLDYVHPNDRQHNQILFTQLIKWEQDCYCHRIRYLTKTGSFKWIEAYVRRVTDESGNTIGTSGVLNDITDHVRAEQAFRDSEERYRQLFMNSPAVKVIHDPGSGCIINANQAAEDFYGYTVKELSSMKITDFDLVYPVEMLNRFEKCNPGESSLFLCRHKLKNGEVRDVEVYSGPVKIEHKTLISSIIIDVTPRRQAEEALQSSRERLDLVIDGAKAGIWDWDMVNGTVYMDKQWKAMLGYEESEISGNLEEWQKHCHPDDMERVKQAMKDYQTGKMGKYEVEYRLRHKNGTYRWVLTMGKITFNQARKALRCVGMNIDITDRKQNEELQLESEKKLKDFAQAVPDISFIIDEEGRYIEVFGNEKMLAKPKGELRGLTVHEVLPPEEAEFVLQEIGATLLSGKPRQGIRKMNMGGVQAVFEGHTVPMRYLANGKRTVALVVIDITERRKAERMLQLSYQLQRRSDFFNDIVNGNVIVDEQAWIFAKTLGVDFSQSLCCYLIASDSFGRMKTEGNRNLTYSQILKNSIIDVLNDDPDYVVWDCRDHIGIVYQAKESNSELNCRQLACGLREKIQSVNSHFLVTIGVGDFQTGAGSFYKSFQQARSAVVVGQCQRESQEGIFYYRDLGIFKLFARYGWKEPINEFVKEHIGKLIQYDEEKGTDYLGTLEEILQASNLKVVAEKLFLHHKTVVFRKQRIEKILAVSIDEFETRLALTMAVKLHKVRKII